ncbi:MAG: shikimate kinase [Rhodobacteraceae bacterium]|nr:shikimate kinase [Paracoccaceae bacterium]
MAPRRRYGLMMGWNVKKTIVMVGMMGAGKTAVGRALAARLGVAFIDSDAEIELAANASIAEIFQRDGEAFFRAKETQVIERLLGGESGILSTGGGAFMQPANRQMISAQGVSVWLDAPLSLLWQRVRHKDTRPLLRTPDPHATLAEMFELRVPVYALANLRVPVLARYSIEDTVDAVIELLQTRPDVLAKE